MAARSQGFVAVLSPTCHEISRQQHKPSLRLGRKALSLFSRPHVTRYHASNTIHRNQRAAPAKFRRLPENT